MGLPYCDAAQPRKPRVPESPRESLFARQRQGPTLIVLSSGDLSAVLAPLVNLCRRRHWRCNRRWCERGVRRRTERRRTGWQNGLDCQSSGGVEVRLPSYGTNTAWLAGPGAKVGNEISLVRGPQCRPVGQHDGDQPGCGLAVESLVPNENPTDLLGAAAQFVRALVTQHGRVA
jgi:hypothetical protein